MTNEKSYKWLLFACETIGAVPDALEKFKHNAGAEHWANANVQETAEAAMAQQKQIKTKTNTAQENGHIIYFDNILNLINLM